MTINELRRGELARRTHNLASPFDAPGWRRPFRGAPGSARQPEPSAKWSRSTTLASL